MSSNWFGLTGLGKFCTAFSKFKDLRKLNLNNNKLCVEDGHDSSIFQSALEAVSSHLEELRICENSIRDEDMVNFLTPAICKMTNLKVLELSRNPITVIGLVGLFN